MINPPGTSVLPADGPSVVGGGARESHRESRKSQSKVVGGSFSASRKGSIRDGLKKQVVSIRESKQIGGLGKIGAGKSMVSEIGEEDEDSDEDPFKQANREASSSSVNEKRTSKRVPKKEEEKSTLDRRTIEFAQDLYEYDTCHIKDRSMQQVETLFKNISHKCKNSDISSSMAIKYA